MQLLLLMMVILLVEMRSGEKGPETPKQSPEDAEDGSLPLTGSLGIKALVAEMPGRESMKEKEKEHQGHSCRHT
jgi:hypothetical protein